MKNCSFSINASGLQTSIDFNKNRDSEKNVSCEFSEKFAHWSGKTL